MMLEDSQNSSTPDDDYHLTNRETQVLRKLAEGLAVKQIPGALNISIHTVKFHIANAYKKLHAKTQAEAVAKAVRKGII